MLCTRHSDAEIWDILEVVELKEAVQSLPGQLQEPVAEGGDNFSAGQRQVHSHSPTLPFHPPSILTHCFLSCCCS